MRYSELRSAVLATVANDRAFTPYVQSSPGTGKTSLCRDVARQYLSGIGVPADNVDARITLFSPSTLDPVDVAGIPTVVDGQTVFNPTYLLSRHRDGEGPGVVIIDELDKAGSVQMQNVLATLILERRVGLMKLDPDTVILCTGNRTEDRAGGQKLMTHLGNRLCVLDMDVSVDDVTAHFLDNGIDPMLVAFLRLRPELLNAFDPNRITNPTPRSWERGARAIPASLPSAQQFALWKGFVGEGAATEWVAARDTMTTMPNPDYCIMQPETAPVPEALGVQHAIATALAARTTQDNFDRVFTYIKRLPRERHIAYMLDVVRRDKTLMNTKTFIQFSLENQDVFAG